MKHLTYFLAIILTAFVLVSTPVKKVEAGPCDTICLLQMGGQGVQDLGSRLQNILNSIQQTIAEWIEDAKAWLDRYLQKAFSTDGNNIDKVKIPNDKVPSLVGKSSGIQSGKSYDITLGESKKTGGGTGAGSSGAAGGALGGEDNKTVSTSTAGMKTGTIEKRAEAKMNELVSTSGTFQGMQYEYSKKAYTAQQDSIDSLAKALVAKNALQDLKEIGDNLDKLQASMQNLAATPPEARTAEQNAELDAQAGIHGGVYKMMNPTGKAIADKLLYEDVIKNRDLHAATKNNIRMRLLWDKMLIMQQQIMAFRLKSKVDRGSREMDMVPKLEEIEIITPQALPSPQEGTSLKDKRK